MRQKYDRIDPKYLTVLTKLVITFCHEGWRLGLLIVHQFWLRWCYKLHWHKLIQYRAVSSAAASLLVYSGVFGGFVLFHIFVKKETIK